jgi:hypothetical protein
VDEEQRGILNLQMFGIDLIFRASDNQPLFIEANSAPQFQDGFAMKSLKHTFGLPMVSGAVDVVEAVAKAAKSGAMSKEFFVKEEPKPSSWACCGTLAVKKAGEGPASQLDENLYH